VGSLSLLCGQPRSASSRRIVQAAPRRATLRWHDDPVSDGTEAAIAGFSWWHVIEVASGVTTPGSWDLRPTADRMPWPTVLEGARGLDIGTMDGFWAFELERRGATDVTAIDLVDPGRQDPFPDGRRRRPTPPQHLRGRTFQVAAELLGSHARYLDLSVYDLDPAEVGEFDVVVMGYVLQMLRDPLRGLEAVRRVCRGHLLLLDTVSTPLSLLPAPMARLDARRDGSEWFVFNRRGLAKALHLTGFEVETVTPILHDRYPHQPDEPLGPVGRAMRAVGLRGRSAAIRARQKPD
jgi:tRNA (mo5U34)-methyltransferase